ncbi:MAG: nucleotide exchange factor GrpE [Pyrinomonadaceae bacterium]
MDPNQKIENLDELSHKVDADETVSVDDFIKELEAKEKDLHITADTTFIEIEDSFDDGGDIPEMLREAASAKGVETVSPVASVPATATATGSAVPAPDMTATVASLREQITRMEADRDEMFKNSQRRARDLETLKTRTERERKETFQSQVGNLATQMLPALDNLNRALDFAGQSLDEKGEEFKQFFDGIALVNQQVLDVFARMGVTQIQTVGRIFDPEFHEAVATETNDDLPSNTISEELLRGYKIGEKVIRHSMVKVSQASTSSTSDRTARPPDDPPADPESEPAGELDKY